MATVNITGASGSDSILTQEGEWYSMVMTHVGGGTAGTLAATFTGADGAASQDYVDKDGNAISKSANYACIFLALGPALVLTLSGGTSADWHVKVNKLTSGPRVRR